MSNILKSILDWLRAGYPDGVPHKDYNPLLVLLQRTLSDDELDAVIEQLAASDPDENVTVEAIKAQIADVTSSPATDEEVRQVAARLAAAGWPLAGTEGAPAPNR